MPFTLLRVVSCRPSRTTHHCQCCHTAQVGFFAAVDVLQFKVALNACSKIMHM